MRSILISIVLISSVASAQQSSYKFYFGSGKTDKEFIAITPDSKFTYQTGYGFSQGSTVNAVATKSKNPLTQTFITSNKPFYFSVKLPDGNYDVKIILGDAEGVSATTVRAENRRLFLPHIITKKGEIVTKNFTVHIRDSMIRDVDGNIIAGFGETH